MKSLRRGVFGVGAVALGIATVGWSSPANAAGFATQRFGGEQGSVLSTNPTSVYYNPGAMGFSGNGGLGLYGSFALRDVSWKHTATPPPPGAPADATLGNSGTAHAFNIFGGPAIGGTVRFGNLVIGGGFFAPFYGRMHWDKNNDLTAAQKAKYPDAVEGVQRWFGVDAELSILYFSAGAAYKLGPLSIGATGNVIYSRIVTLSSKDLTNSVPETTSETRENLYVDGWNGSFGAGAMLEIVPQQFYLAAGYQSQPAMGEQVLTGTLTTTNAAGVQHQNVEFHQNLPDVYRAGVRYRPKQIPWEFRVFGDYTRWSVMTSQCLNLQNTPCVVQSNGANLPTPPNPGGVLANFRRDWDDSYGIRVGASWWVKPDIETFLGLGYETAAIPDATMTPDLTDANNYAATLGARLKLSDMMWMSLSWTHIQFVDRDNTGQSTLAVKNGQPVQVPTATEDGGGVYKQWVGVFTGNLEALF